MRNRLSLMQFRIYGVILLAAAVLMLWYFVPHDGKLYYPKRFETLVGQIVPLVVVFLIGLAVPLILFGTPGRSILSGSH
jgi:hypothetical protein